jgi:hypothetical protein
MRDMMCAFSHFLLHDEINPLNLKSLQIHAADAADVVVTCKAINYDKAAPFAGSTLPTAGDSAPAIVYINEWICN